MDFWIAILLCGSGLSIILAFHTFVVNGISARATIAAVPDPRQRKKFNVYMHLTIASFLLTTTGFLVLFVTRSNSASAVGSSSQQAAATCPCPEATPQPTTIPVKENQTSSATTPSTNQTQATLSPKGKNFLIDGIRYDHSHNALMGRFSGTLFIENGSVKFVNPHPVFRLAGRHEIWGQRTVKGIKIGIGDYDEVIKVSQGQEGDVTWSEPFELTATRDHGEEYAENKTIELSVPVGMTDLKDKAVIVQIDNKLTSSGKTLEPSYAISGREIFSGSSSSQQTFNNQTRRKRVPIRRRNSC